MVVNYFQTLSYGKTTRKHKVLEKSHHGSWNKRTITNSNFQHHIAEHITLKL